MARFSPIQARSPDGGVQVASATGNTLLCAEDLSCLKRTIFNDSTAILYVKVGVTGASATSKSFNIAPGGYFEVFDTTAVIYGAWATANGFAYVTTYR